MHFFAYGNLSFASIQQVTPTTEQQKFFTVTQMQTFADSLQILPFQILEFSCFSD